MDREHLKGAADKVKGAVKETAGKLMDDKKLQAWYSDIAHICTHNAYHIGQIVYVRKEQGSWDPAKGVK